MNFSSRFLALFTSLIDKVLNIEYTKPQSKTTAGAKAIRVKDGKGCTAGEIDYTPYYWVNMGKKELDYGIVVE
jgi:hypothetical protein